MGIMSNFEAYKVCREEHAMLAASGIENRWNRKDEYVIYVGSSRSLATLELVAHRSGIMPSKAYKLITISISEEDDLIKEIDNSILPKRWNRLEAYPELQKLGSEWYQAKETLILKVPSAIIHQEYNFVINTEHPLFLTKIKLIKVEDFFWDKRLL
jgi:RES domain-containing protein